MANFLDLHEAAAVAKRMLVPVRAKIAQTQHTKGGIPVWANYSFHGLEAIAEENYGLEYPDMAILRVMSRLTGWRGPEASQLKEQMNAVLKKAGY